MTSSKKFLSATPHNVDGRTPAPVDMEVDITLFTRFYTSQVVQDFFHQQYQIMVEGLVVWGLVVWIPKGSAYERHCCTSRIPNHRAAEAPICHWLTIKMREKTVHVRKRKQVTVVCKHLLPFFTRFVLANTLGCNLPLSK